MYLGKLLHLSISLYDREKASHPGGIFYLQTLDVLFTVESCWIFAWILIRCNGHGNINQKKTRLGFAVAPVRRQGLVNKRQKKTIIRPSSCSTFTFQVNNILLCGFCQMEVLLRARVLSMSSKWSQCAVCLWFLDGKDAAWQKQDGGGELRRFVNRHGSSIAQAHSSRVCSDCLRKTPYCNSPQGWNTIRLYQCRVCVCSDFV